MAHTGVVIGATDKQGEEVVESRASPGDFLSACTATWPIDSERAQIPDFAGRPVPVLGVGRGA